MANPYMALPPKMLAQYAAKARAGQADKTCGNCFYFYSSRQEIVLQLFGLNDADAVGSIRQMKAQEWDAHMAELVRK